MDKITKVQEVSSFIVNFDNKYWNEVILRLTIIGIRYVTNNYQNKFSWKLNDLNMILEQFNIKKDQKKFNHKTHYTNKRESKKLYNYNYNNSSFIKNQESNNSINGKKLNFNNLTQNEINNSNMSIMSERNYFGKDRFLKKMRKNKGQNNYLKNKSNRNKILSLKQNSFDKNDKKINVVVSNFPFHQGSSTINEKENYKNQFEKSRDNFVFYLNQEKNNGFSTINRMSSIDRNNNKNHLDRVHNSFGEFIPKYSSKEYSIKRNNNKLIDEISSKKDDYKKDSKEFISELRRLSQNKDYKPKNNKKTYTNKIANQQPKLSVCYSTPLIDTNKTNLKSNYLNNSEIDLRENIEKSNKTKLDISITKKSYEKEKKENSLLNTINNRKYNFKSTNDNLQINFQYGGCNNNINNNESVSNIENIPSLLNTNNKYLENTSQRSAKMKYNYKKDTIKKEKNTLNFEYTTKKENSNNNNNLSSNLNSNIDLSFKQSNSNKNNFFYEIQPSPNKKNNTEIINNYKKAEEIEIKENNNMK